jgi:hypothetical protein
MKYALLLYDVPANWANVDDARMADLHGEYMAVADDSRSFGGAQLDPAHPSKTLRLRPDGELLVTDGPFAETKEVLSGFYLVEAGSEEEAIEIAQRIPTLSRMGGAVEVRQIVDREDMQ